LPFGSAQSCLASICPLSSRRGTELSAAIVPTSISSTWGTWTPSPELFWQYDRASVRYQDLFRFPLIGQARITLATGKEQNISLWPACRTPWNTKANPVLPPGLRSCDRKCEGFARDLEKRKTAHRAAYPQSKVFSAFSGTSEAPPNPEGSLMCSCKVARAN